MTKFIIIIQLIFIMLKILGVFTFSWMITFCPFFFGLGYGLGWLFDNQK